MPRYIVRRHVVNDYSLTLKAGKEYVLVIKVRMMYRIVKKKRKGRFKIRYVLHALDLQHSHSALQRYHSTTGATETNFAIKSVLCTIPGI